MSGFQVGDVVVRIHEPFYDHHLAPPLKKPVRVTALVFGGHGICVSGFPSSHETRAWQSGHFRKVVKADEKFTALIRACKPHRVGEPA